MFSRQSVRLKVRNYLLAILFLLLPVHAAYSELHTSIPNQYPIDCGEHFFCPPSLMKRVSFWVDVFSRWETNTAVFHDKNNPHRVFSTIRREQGCRQSHKGDAIDRQKQFLKKELTRAGRNLQRQKRLTSSQQLILSNQFSDLPVVERAEAMLQAADNIRCQSGNHDRMKQALERYHLYRPTILRALAKYDLNPELLYLPFVESAFNPEALSHLGAAGLWQIMPVTGRKLGLRLTNSVDERYDPIRATDAAAAYLDDSIKTLSQTARLYGHDVSDQQLLPFVITSYNYGVYGMQRAIAKVGLDYTRLLTDYRSPNFQTAVKNFYASFLAARHVAMNQSKFFPEIQPLDSKSPEFDIITLTRATSIERLSSELGVSRETMQQLNPSIRRLAWRDKVLLPSGFRLNLPPHRGGWAPHVAQMDRLPRELERPGFVYHKVRRGQTVCGIAASYNTSCHSVKRLNRLNRKATIYAGRKIKVPLKGVAVFIWLHLL